MRSLIAASCAIAAFAMPVYAAPVVGKVAPDFTAETTTGESITLSEIEGTVVLEWTNHDCPFVKKHYKSGNMQDTQKVANENGATWITIISSAKGKQGYVDAEKANALTEKRDAEPSYVILDPSGEIGKLYRAKTTPHMFVIDDKNVAYAGAIDSVPSGNAKDIDRAENYVLSAMSDIKDNVDVRTPTSNPYGCSVKYGS